MRLIRLGPPPLMHDPEGPNRASLEDLRRSTEPGPIERFELLGYRTQLLLHEFLRTEKIFGFPVTSEIYDEYRYRLGRYYQEDSILLDLLISELSEVNSQGDMMQDVYDEESSLDSPVGRLHMSEEDVTQGNNGLNEISTINDEKPETSERIIFSTEGEKVLRHIFFQLALHFEKNGYTIEDLTMAIDRFAGYLWILSYNDEQRIEFSLSRVCYFLHAIGMGILNNEETLEDLIFQGTSELINASVYRSGPANFN